jgi:hypothetical protein
MMNFTELASVRSDRPVLFTDQLRLAVAAYRGPVGRGHPLEVACSGAGD